MLKEFWFDVLSFDNVVTSLWAGTGMDINLVHIGFSQENIHMSINYLFLFFKLRTAIKILSMFYSNAIKSVVLD